MTAARAYKPRHMPHGGPLKRHVKPKGARGAIVLADDHAAVVEGRSLFPSTVVHSSLSPRVLVSGVNSRKIGKAVTKGRWRGMPIFTLTLEERSHCPRTCGEWASCYGNHMHYARRHIGDEVLEHKLAAELSALQAAHPAGFVVRLHVLGDFYSALYVDFWRKALDVYPALRVFGFTAHAMASAIGAALLDINFHYHDRFRVRFSGTDEDGLGSMVINTAADSQHVLCPVQTDATDCCGTCGLCWTMDRVIEFVRH